MYCPRCSCASCTCPNEKSLFNQNVHDLLHTNREQARIIGELKNDIHLQKEQLRFYQADNQRLGAENAKRFTKIAELEKENDRLRKANDEYWLITIEQAKKIGDVRNENENLKKENEQLKKPSGVYYLSRDHEEEIARNRRLQCEVDYLKRENRSLVDIVNIRWEAVLPPRESK